MENWKQLERRRRRAIALLKEGRLPATSTDFTMIIPDKRDRAPESTGEILQTAREEDAAPIFRAWRLNNDDSLERIPA